MLNSIKPCFHYQNARAEILNWGKREGNPLLIQRVIPIGSQGIVVFFFWGGVPFSSSVVLRFQGSNL